MLALTEAWWSLCLGRGDGVLKLMARQPTGGTIDVAPGNKPTSLN